MMKTNWQKNKVEDSSKEDKLSMILGYLEFIRHRGAESFIERDKFTVEREIKTLEIYLNCCVGLLGFISLGAFLFTGLQGYTVVLLIGFVFITLLNIVIIIITRNKKVKEVELLFERRGRLAQQIEEEVIKDIDRIIMSDDEEFQEFTYKTKESEKSRLEEIRKETLQKNLLHFYSIIDLLGLVQLVSLFGLIVLLLCNR